MKWIDLVKIYFPKANEKLCDFILWEHTCFPMCSKKQIEIQLDELSKKDIFKDFK